MEKNYMSRIEKKELTHDELVTILQQCRQEHDLEISNAFSSVFSRVFHFSHKAPFPQHTPA